MKIEQVEIKNFRSRAKCKLEFPNLLALIGENNAGKSNIIYALRLFFNENKADTDCDFLDPSKPIEITIKFKDLTDFEKSKITEAHRTDSTLVLKKTYSSDDEVKTTSIKDGAETNASPRGA